MDDRRFGAQVTVTPEGADVHMRGDLDGRAEDAITTAYAEVGGAGDGAPVTLDFTDVGYINSTGIALVVRILADARRDDRHVRAVGLTAHYREIFRITRLSDFMDIVEGAAA